MKNPPSFRMEDFLFLISPARSLQKSKEEKQRLVEEKGGKSEGIWNGNGQG